MEAYGYTVATSDGYDEAVTRARLAFRSEGFSVLSEMHVGGMLGPEAGDKRQYLIMGVWNSAVQDRALDGDDQLRVAVHLPCNLVVQEQDQGSLIAALDPGESVDPADTDSALAADVARDALTRVLRKIEAPQQ